MRHPLITIPALLLAVLSLGALPARADEDSPRAVIDDIYGQVNAMCGGDGNGPAYDITEIAKAHFTPALKATFEASMDSEELGFDILVDAQDCKTTDLTLSILDSADTSAKARATFKNMGAERVVDLEMTKIGEAWKVSDVAYGHRPFSLKALTVAAPSGN
ncbi:MAG: hypothetical protein AB7S70_09870 [Hyphomicrobium sp.]|uniref:hypothetical protein n=1 Tax=Hyphomicrobium sp. TaxID=82 RepID=UPI003D1499DA